MPKVLLINGSPHPQGCTYTALRQVADTLAKNGVTAEIYPAFAGLAELRDTVAECWQIIVAENVPLDEAVQRATSRAADIVAANNP